MKSPGARNLMIRKDNRGFSCSGGEGGIRTRGRVLPYTRFPGVFIIDILLFIFLYLTP